MLLNEKDKSYIWDIIDACEDIENFIKEIDFINNIKELKASLSKFI